LRVPGPARRVRRSRSSRSTRSSGSSPETPAARSDDALAIAPTIRRRARRASGAAAPRARGGDTRDTVCGRPDRLDGVSPCARVKRSATGGAAAAAPRPRARRRARRTKPIAVAYALACPARRRDTRAWLWAFRACSVDGRAQGLEAALRAPGSICPRLSVPCRPGSEAAPRTGSTSVSSGLFTPLEVERYLRKRLGLLDG
jgi:hypothetical protein